jgi:hypothetical protein
MRTQYLVDVRYCSAINEDRIEMAGGHLVGLSRVEDDHSVIVDIEVDTHDPSIDRRLSDLFTSITHPHRQN